MNKQLSPENILQTGMAFWASKTLLSAVEMGVFTELAHGPESFDSLSGRLGLHPRSARDFLDTLVALGFLERKADVYANTPETDVFLDRKKPSYVGGILEMANHRLYPFWGQLTEALRTGLPQNESATGATGFFEILYSDPARLKEFLGAMTGVSHGANMTIAHAFPWKDYRTFVDIGTAQGDLAVQIALTNPHLEGAGFDLPEVAPIFEEYVSAAGVMDRLIFKPGDFFKQDIPKADVVLMGHILHDWDLPTKKMLVKKAFDALPVGGAFVVYEAIIDDDRSKNAFGLMMSLNMLIETPGGFDYSGSDCAAWISQPIKNMRVSVKPIKEYPWILRPFFWNQKRKYGAILQPGLLWARVPKLFGAVALLYGALDKKSSPLSPVLRSLVTVRVSQINWCRFCVDINSATLAERSGSMQKVEQLAQWKESDLFDAKEKVVLEYTEAVTYSDQQVTDELMQRLKEFFDDNGIVELTGLIAFQNLSSKFNSALDVPPQGFCELPYEPPNKNQTE